VTVGGVNLDWHLFCLFQAIRDPVFNIFKGELYEKGIFNHRIAVYFNAGMGVQLLPTPH